MCAIGRALVARHPNWGYSPTCDEFREMTAIYIGAPSPLAAQLSVGNRVWSMTRRKTALTLDAGGFALTINQEPAGLSTDSWRSHHDAAAYMLYHNALKAGLEGRMDVWGLFTSLLPQTYAQLYRAARDGLVPDALLRRPTENDAVYKDQLHDLKTFHMSGTTYRDSKVKEKGAARNADTRADKVNTEYVYTRHATSMRSFSKLNPMRTLGQSQRGSTHTREFEDTAWERLRNAAQTSTCCCGRRPSPQQSTICAKSVPALLRKQLLQLTWQHTAADGVQKSPCRQRASGSQGRI